MLKKSMNNNKYRILFFLTWVIFTLIFATTAWADYAQVEINNIPTFGQRKSYTIPLDINPRGISVDVSVNGGYGDCGIACVSMIEAYFKGYPSEDTRVYHAVMAARNPGVQWSSVDYDPGSETTVQPYPLNGYSYNSVMSADQIYQSIKQGNPVMVHRKYTTGGYEHWVVIYGYDGPSTSIDWTCFKIMSPTWASARVFYQHLSDLVSNYDMLNCFMYRTSGLDNLPSLDDPTPEEIHKTQIIERAENIYNTLVGKYGSLEGYINKCASDKEYYMITLNDAGLWNTTYSSCVDFCVTLGNVGVSVLFDSPSETLQSIGETALKKVKSEVSKGVPKMSTQDFIYNQAKSGLGRLSYDIMWDVIDRRNSGSALFPTEESAVDFILEYQRNKAAFASAQMGKDYYIDELNKSPWEILGLVIHNIAASQIGDLFRLSDNWFISDVGGQAAEGAVNLLDLLVEQYSNNKYMMEWRDRLKEIQRETNSLLEYVPETPVALPVYHTVTYDPCGGNVGKTEYTVYEGGTFYMPTPFRFGYNFLGWFDSADGGTQYASSRLGSLSSDLSLYAHWERIILSSGSCGPDLSYTLYGDGILDITGTGEMTSHPWTTSYSERVGDVTFPEGLTSICNNAFENCKYLRELNLPSNVVSIGNYAFKYSGLTSLTLPDGLQTLGVSILNGNQTLKELIIPGSVTTMSSTFATYYSGADQGTFERCGLEKVIIQEGVTRIGNLAFVYCTSLKEVILPDTLTEIGTEAFEGCRALEHINIPDSVTHISYRAFMNTGLKELILPANVISVGSRVLSGSTEVKSLYIPKTLTSAPVGERLGDSYSMLRGSSVERVEFEAGREIIPNDILYYATAVTEVILPEGITEIGSQAFSYCTSLRQIDIPESVVKIGQKAFYGSGLEDLRLPSNISTIGSEFLYNTNVKSIIIPNTMTSYGSFLSGSPVERVEFEEGIETIPDKCLSGAASLTEIILPSTVKTIGSEAFAKTGITSLDLPEGVETLGYLMISGCKNLKELKVPGSVKTMRYIRSSSNYQPCGPFTSSYLEKVEIGEGVTSIGERAFYDATALEEIAIPESVTSIGQYAFYNCGALKELELPEAVTTIGANAFHRSGLEELRLPSNISSIGSEFLYGSNVISLIIPNSLTASGRFLAGSSVERVEFEEGIETIPDKCLSGAASLTEVVLPSTVKTIGVEAFAGTGITSLDLPEGVETLGYLMISGCKDLKELKVPGSVKTMRYIRSSSSYQPCGPFTSNYLEKVEIGEGVTSIGERAFYNATALEEIVIPESVTSIGAYAFYGCPEDRMVIYGSEGSYVQTYAETNSLRFISLENRKMTPDAVLPSYMVMIGNKAFENCAFSAVKIPDGTISIGERAFAKCRNLKQIEIPGSVTTIADDAFAESPGVVIYCTAGSKAYEFAVEKSINYVIDN